MYIQNIVSYLTPFCISWSRDYAGMHLCMRVCMHKCRYNMYACMHCIVIYLGIYWAPLAAVKSKMLPAWALRGNDKFSSNEQKNTYQVRLVLWWTWRCWQTMSNLSLFRVKGRISVRRSRRLSAVGSIPRLGSIALLNEKEKKKRWKRLEDGPRLFSLTVLFFQTNESPNRNNCG